MQLLRLLSSNNILCSYFGEKISGINLLPPRLCVQPFSNEKDQFVVLFLSALAQIFHLCRSILRSGYEQLLRFQIKI